MGNWKSMLLKDFCIFNANTYGNKDVWIYVNYLDTGNITNNKIEKVQYIDLNKEKLPSRARRKISYNSIIYSTVRPNQLHYGIIKNIPDNFLVSTGFVVIDVDEKIADADFIYYWLSQSSITDKLQAIAEQSTSTYPSIKVSDLAELEIYLPPLWLQKNISGILSIIDKKITNNDKINRNLSEQIAALYQAWFIDYEPFKDGDFVDSEVGEIPVGWRVEKLVNLCDTISKKHKFDKEELIFLNTGDIEDGRFLHGNYSAVEGMPGQAKKSIKENDILYSEIRPVNRHFAFVNFEAEDYVVSTKLMVIRSKGMEPRRLYQFLTSQPVIDELQLEAESRSGTFPQIRFENVGALKMVVATDDVEKKYAELLQKFYAQIDKNVMENQRLTELRDSLLPKLMSGELDVSDLNI